MDYATLLRQARLDAGLTQAELARRAGTSQPAIVRYELGHASPTTRTLAKLLETCSRAKRPASQSIRPRRKMVSLWESPTGELEDAFLAHQMRPFEQGQAGKSGRAAIEAKWRARGVDVDRLIEAMHVGADQRIKRLEDFVSDMRSLRSQTDASRRR
jgi:transcriptional regulator with XRE-family HTH domain